MKKVIYGNVLIYNYKHFHNIIMKIHIRNKNTPIRKRNIPNNITKLILGDKFNQELIYFPPKLKSIKFGKYYDKKVTLPEGIEEIEFGDEFDQYIDFLPSSLKIIKFGKKFNSGIHNFPDELEVLDFGDEYNKPIDNLPRNLKKLILRKMFNQPLEFLPKKLLYLELNNIFYYNYSINDFPSSLETLILITEYHFKKEINVLPPRLKYFEFKSKNCEKIILPKTIEVLILDNFLKFDKLPPKIKKLKMPYDFNQCINLPDTLLDIEFSNSFNQIISIFPSKLQNLKFGYAFNNKLPVLPETLETLEFGSAFNQELSFLPENLKILKFGNYFNSSIDFFPTNLKKLIFGDYYNLMLPKLSDSITHLEFGRDFNEPVDYFPLNLEKLIFGDKFNQTLNNLPHGLTELTLGFNFNHSLINFPESIHTLLIHDHPIVLASIPSFIKKLTIIGDVNAEEEIDNTQINLPMILNELILKNYYYRISSIECENIILDKIPFECKVEHIY